MRQVKKISIPKLNSNTLEQIKGRFYEGTTTKNDVSALITFSEAIVSFIARTEVIYKGQGTLPSETCPFINDVLDDLHNSISILRRITCWRHANKATTSVAQYAFEKFSKEELADILTGILNALNNAEGNLEYVRKANEKLRTVGAVWALLSKYFSKMMAKAMKIKINHLKLNKSKVCDGYYSFGVSVDDWDVTITEDEIGCETLDSIFPSEGKESWVKNADV